MSGWIITFLLWGLVAAGLRLAYEAGRGDFRQNQKPRTTTEIAKEGLRRAERAQDTSHRHYNAKIRS